MGKKIIIESTEELVNSLDAVDEVTDKKGVTEIFLPVYIVTGQVIGKQIGLDDVCPHRFL